VVGGENGSIAVPQGSPFTNLLTGLGFQVSEETDMEPAVWRKLAVNASLNVVASIFGVRNGEILDIPEASQMVRLASAEVERVARARGVNFGPLSGWEIAREVALGTAGNVCSTLADLLSGRVTEYQAINGEVLRVASQLGVDVPTLRRLHQEFYSIDSAVEAA
jgi:2-dehydropantoate 2-reductase